MRITSNYRCGSCLYFDPDNNYCMLDTDYQTVSPKKTACSSYASDDDDFNPIEINKPIDLEDDYDYFED